MSCSHCPDAIHNTNRNDSAPLKKVERNDFRKCEQHETQSRRVKIKFKISESRDIIVIANALLGYYYQKFNAILQVNAIYFQRRKKLLTIINLMSNTRKTYKKKQILRRFWIRQAQTSLRWDKFLQDKVIKIGEKTLESQKTQLTCINQFLLSLTKFFWSRKKYSFLYC